MGVGVVITFCGQLRRSCLAVDFGDDTCSNIDFLVRAPLQATPMSPQISPPDVTVGVDRSPFHPRCTHGRCGVLAARCADMVEFRERQTVVRLDKAETLWEKIVAILCEEFGELRLLSRCGGARTGMREAAVGEESAAREGEAFVNTSGSAGVGSTARRAVSKPLWCRALLLAPGLARVTPGVCRQADSACGTWPPACRTPHPRTCVPQ